MLNNYAVDQQSKTQHMQYSSCQLASMPRWKFILRSTQITTADVRADKLPQLWEMRERCLQARTANCQTQTDCRRVLCPCVCVCVLQKENRGVLGWQKSHCRGKIRLCGWIHAVIDPQQWSVCGRGMYEEAREAMSHTKHTHTHTHTHTHK